VQRFLAIIILVFIPLLIFTGCGRDYSAEKQLWYADKLRNEKLKDPEKATPKDYKKVIASYEKILKKYPDWGKNGKVLLTIARLYARQGNLSRAEEEFKKVLEDYPRDIASSIEAQASIGSIYEQRGEWKKAEIEYKKVATNFPHVANNRLLLRTFEMPLYIARHYQASGQMEKAKEVYAETIAGYQKVKEKNKENELGAVAQSYIARAYMNQGKWEEAIKAFQTLITDYAKSPQAAMAFYRIGQIYQKQLKLPIRAIATYRKYIEDYPKKANAKEAQFNLGSLYAQEGDYAQAIKELQLVLNKYPQDNKLSPAAQLAIASLYEKEDKWDQALTEYRKVLSDFPKTVSALRVPLHIAQYYQSKEKKEEAQKAYQEAVAYYKKVSSENKGTPFGLAATEFLANTYFAQKDWETGINILQTIPANYPNVPRAATAFYRIGQIYQKQLKLPIRAIETYRKYIKNYPKEAKAKEAQFNLSSLYAQQGDYSQAIKEFQLVLKKYPRDNNLSPAAQLAIASLYEKEDKWDQALTEYRKVLSDFPKTVSALRVPLHIAEYYQSKEKTEEAQKAYQEAVAYYKKVSSENKGTPFGLAATEFLADTYFSRKDWETGINILQKLIDDYPKSPRTVNALFRIAEVYQTGLNEGKQAIQVYERIRKKYTQPDIAAPALFRIGLVYQNILKQPEQAKTIYRKFLADYPKYKLRDKVKEELDSLSKSK